MKMQMPMSLYIEDGKLWVGIPVQWNGEIRFDYRGPYDIEPTIEGLPSLSGKMGFTEDILIKTGAE